MTTRKVYSLKKVNKPFICEKCGQGFKQQDHLDKHLARVNPCNATYECKRCHMAFKSNSILKRHINRKTSCTIEEVPVVTADNEENRCYMCNKTFSTKSSLRRHQKNSCNTNNPQNMNKMIELLLEKERKIAKLEVENNMLKTASPQTIINNNTVNQTFNNNLYMNVTICSFGNEDLSRLDPEKVMNLLKNHADEFVPKMIEQVHANPDIPEYHNVFYDPKREKAIVFAPISDNEKSWKIRDFKEVSDELTQKIREYIRPGASHYFDTASQAKDYDTSNSISKIAYQTNWATDEIIEKNQNVLTKVSKNKSFLELVDVE